VYMFDFQVNRSLGVSFRDYAGSMP
jgi:hypothetical protein